MNPELTHFDQLDFSRQCALINQAPFVDKGDLILRSMSPEAILPTLTGEDFFLVYSEASSELQPAILRHGTSEQLVFVSDFECWEKDQVDGRGFCLWVDQLSQIEREQFENWLVEADIELIISGYMKFTEVIKTEHLEMIDDYLGDRPFFTLDNLYYICIEGDHSDVLREGVEILYERQRSVYLTLVEGLICETEVLVEEEAFQSRLSRMARYGFPEKEEAMRIYQEIADWSQVEKKPPLPEGKPTKGEDVTVSLPVTLEAGEPLFLDQVLQLYYETSGADDTLQTEFVALGNRIIVCEDMDFTRSEAIRQSLRRARSLVSIALEDLSRGQVAQGALILGDYWMEDLYRFSITLLKQLRHKTETLFRETRFPDFSVFCDFLGDPWKYKVRGWMRFCPMSAKPRAELEIEEFEDFKSLAQVHRAAHELREIRELLRFLEGHLGSDWSGVLQQNFKGLNLGTQPLTMNVMMATAFARVSLDGALSFEPLSVKDIKAFILKAFDTSVPLRRLRSEARESFAAILPTGALREGAAFLEILYRSLEEELGALNLSAPLEARYLPLLLARDFSPGPGSGWVP